MKVRELLTDPVLVPIAPTASALEGARKMAAEHVGSLLVLDDAGRMLGIFTERDLMVRVVAAARAPAEVLIEEVMTRDVFTASPDATVLGLREEMRSRHIRHVPILEDGRILAVLSMRDLVRAALEEHRAEVAHMTRYIQGEEA